MSLDRCVEAVEFAVSSACLSTALGYLLNGAKVVCLANPLQAGVYGAVAAVVISIAIELMGERDESLEYFAVGAAIVVGAGVTPLSFYAGACLFPAVIVAKRVADVCRESL